MIDKIFSDFKQRSGYTEEILPFIGQHLIKVLVGQRRSGKSYVLYQVMNEIRRLHGNANIIYLNTELSENRSIRTYEDLYANVSSRLKPELNYVFIDEIQEISGFEKAVQSLYAESSCDIYITGSNSHLLSGELATYLAGRYVQFVVHPLSYREFLSFYGCENSVENLRKYLRIGGMPYLAALSPLANSEDLAKEYLYNLYQSILLRDVLARENIRNVRFLENLAMYIADNTGNIFSANNISKYLKNQKTPIPVQSVITYLSALEKAQLIHKVQRIEINGLKIFEIGEKYFFEDIGLRNIISCNPIPMDMNKIIENAVYLFLIQRHWSVYVGKLNDGEVDFVGVKGNEKIYVQVAYRIDDPSTFKREFDNLERINDQFPKYVVTMDEVTPNVSYKGIWHIHLKDFLVKQL